MDSLLTESQLRLRHEAREFAQRDVPRQLILDMDAGRVSYPRSFLQSVAARRLLGLRFPQAYGGRGLGWAD
ncbi:MAG TPA: acyl-CoA dehydrogenase family protein, partial [Anaerolineales bacterium]|nr:acyl-CoA dehydrogenase family protein [Anaerolineales bacterium]